MMMMIMMMMMMMEGRGGSRSTKGMFLERGEVGPPQEHDLAAM